ncbi:MAG: glucosaminidase domain-containing protein [Wenzhouxiangellaceae bacterium]
MKHEHDRDREDRQTTRDAPQSRMARITAMVRPVPVVVGLVLVVLLVASVVGIREDRQLPDFAAIEDLSERKQAFFEFLAPIVMAENQRVLEQRERLLDLAGKLRAGEPIGWLDRRWLGQLAEEYAVGWNPDAPLESIEPLERRVDAVPVSLALVQAATESGWGRSRFATEANNLFGHWCYQPGCGLVPERRNTGAGHEVAAFDSVADSVERYLRNLNTHAAYAPLRAIRARMRRNGESPTAMALADGLVRYSERREDYVAEIKTVIRVNRPIIERVRETL